MAQVGYDGHQQLAAQHQEAGHHVYGKPPLWQADLEPLKREVGAALFALYL